jgi:hypothetical protein
LIDVVVRIALFSPRKLPMPGPLPIIINPDVAPTEITGTCTGSVWTGSYSFTPPDDSQETSFQQAAFLPPCSNTSSPGLTNTSITAASGSTSLETGYTGAWVCPAYFFPDDAELAFIVRQPIGGWPTGGIMVTIVLTYPD